MKTRLLLFAAALALSPIGYAQPVKVSVAAVDSIEDLKAWLGKPIDPARAAALASYPGRLPTLPLGKKTQLPILVTGLAPPSQPLELVADVEILGTDGRALGASPRCCRATIARASKQSAVLLDSAVIVEPEAGHKKGSYTVRVSVTDGSQTWTATEVFPYGLPDDVPGLHEAAPKLRMNVPAAQAESAAPGDKRDCLSLPTPAEVIKCSEKK